MHWFFSGKWSQSFDENIIWQSLVPFFFSSFRRNVLKPIYNSAIVSLFQTFNWRQNTENVSQNTLPKAEILSGKNLRRFETHASAFLPLNIAAVGSVKNLFKPYPWTNLTEGNKTRFHQNIFYITDCSHFPLENQTVSTLQSSNCIF